MNLRKIKIERHPINWVLEKFSASNSIEEISKFTFSIYDYVPQTVADRRVNFSRLKNEFDIDFLVSTISGLSNREELAILSKVIVNDSIMHIPMIDLGGRHNEISNIKALRTLQEYWDIDFALYDSGRSFHAYGNRLISNSDWIKFMGHLLLINEPGKSKLIDTRWVGHRILAGYSALRWSFNTTQYKRYPTFIGLLSEFTDISEPAKSPSPLSVKWGPR